jgi:tryptophan synthase beta chain
MKIGATMPKNSIILINLSGRGDKDVQEVARIKGIGL